MSEAHSPVDEAALLRAFRHSREPTDFAPLMRSAAARVNSVIYRVVLCPTTTEDLVQETFVKAYRQFDSFEGRSAFSSWVCRIGVNLAISHLRRERRRPSNELIDDTLPDRRTERPDVRLMKGEYREQVDQAMAALSPELRAALVMSVIEEIPTAEIAAALDCSPATVYWRVHQARKQLKQYIQQTEMIPSEPA